MNLLHQFTFTTSNYIVYFIFKMASIKLEESFEETQISTTNSTAEIKTETAPVQEHHPETKPHTVPPPPPTTLTVSSSADKNKKRLFAKELRCMLFGFGDDVNPYTETVDMLEDLVIHFIGDTALRALEVGRSGRVTVEDVMYLVRRDPRKYSRVRDLLNMNEELKKARKAFDEVKYVQSV